jgi:predicted dehydrogenase
MFGGGASVVKDRKLPWACGLTRDAAVKTHSSPLRIAAVPEKLERLRQRWKAQNDRSDTDNGSRGVNNMFQTDRRGFLCTSAAAGVWAASHVAQGEEKPTSVRLGVIGVGWYGMVDAKAALKVGGVEVTAICDVDRDHLEKAATELEKLQGKRPQAFHRHEDLFESNAIDVVIIASPPHWHALQLLAALEAGVDVYCEKPLAYDIREGRAMVDAVEASDRVVQVGFQRRQSQAMKDASQFIKSGGIGQLVQVDAQIHYRAGLNDPTPQDPPASLDWDRWCGPGPLIPYSPQVGHKSWRLEKTSGHGHLVDWGIHLIDAVRNMCGLSMPKQVTAAGGLYHYQDRITTPDTLSVHFEFDQLPVHWRHRLWGATEAYPATNNGIFFYGDEGTVFVSDRTWTVWRPGKRDEPEQHEANADMGTLHMADFLQAVRSRRQPVCSVADGFRSTATVQLAMIAYETNSVVQWDEATEVIVDNPVASRLLKRDYRTPWRHPFSS